VVSYEDFVMEKRMHPEKEIFVVQDMNKRRPKMAPKHTSIAHTCSSVRTTLRWPQHEKTKVIFAKN